jgi:hypothetical protein
MIRAVLGMKAFQSGLGAYMKKHAYGNTETYDLWKAWEESSGLPVQEMMASWTEQVRVMITRFFLISYGVDFFLKLYHTSGWPSPSLLVY